MEPIAIVLTVVAALALLSLAGVGLYLVRRSAPVVAPGRVAADDAEPVSLMRYRRRNRCWIGAFAVALVVIAAVIDQLPQWLESSWPLWLAALAIAVIALWPHPGVRLGSATGVRSAEVRPRTITNVAPAWALVPPAVGAAVLVVFLIVAGIAAQPHGGRVIALAPGATSEAQSIPFPGWPFGLPILVALVPLVIATLVALRRIAAYAAPLDPQRWPLDAAMRQTSTRLVMKLATAAIFVCLGYGLATGGTTVGSAAYDLTGEAGSMSASGWQVTATVMWAGGVVYTLLALLLTASLVIDAWCDPRVRVVPDGPRPGAES